MSNEYKSLFFLEQYPEKIPNKPGNYFWYYYPRLNEEFKNLNAVELENYFKKYSSKKLTFPVSLYDRQKKFHLTIEEVEFYNPLGLNENQLNDLILFILKSEANFEYFKKFFEKLCFLRPFYIGKAIDLRSRLKQHFDGKSSELLEHIYLHDIDKRDIIISYEVLNSDSIDNNENLAIIFEKILQAKVRPTLVKKYG